MTPPVQVVQGDREAELRALLAKATPGPWLYRPEEYDDWGFIRGGDRTEFGLPVVALGRSGGLREDTDEHRRNKTDPYGPNAELIVAMRNALPDLLDEIERLRKVEAEWIVGKRQIEDLMTEIHAQSMTMQRQVDLMEKATRELARQALGGR